MEFQSITPIRPLQADSAQAARWEQQNTIHYV